MAFKVNYNQQRAERDRAKLAKKEAKLREQEAELMRRRNGTPRADEPAEPLAEPAADGVVPGVMPGGEKPDGTP